MVRVGPRSRRRQALADDAFFVRRSASKLVGVGFQMMRVITFHRCTLLRVYSLHMESLKRWVEGGCLLYYPAALDAQADALIEARVPSDKRFAASEKDAVHFACKCRERGEHDHLELCNAPTRFALGVARF